MSDPSHFSRRKFLTASAGVLLSALVVPNALANPDFWEQPRTLSLVRPDTGERVQATYWDNGAIPSGYAELCHLLRDTRIGATVAMEPRLLDLLFGIQGYVEALDDKLPWLTIISGYRAESTNRLLIRQGLPASLTSRHISGEAVDIKVAGMKAAMLGKVARRMGAGGVGVYSTSCHVDIGPKRSW